MCGIVGFIGDTPEKVLISNLKKLEYRGYDSAGIAVKSESDLRIFKSKGEIKNLEKIMQPLDGANMGIGHTRWATHGVPDEINAHPHVSENGEWCVVHNGIIENYNYLKDKLSQKGYAFYSQTDTETIAKLLEYYNDENLFSTIQKTCSSLDGSFALCIINRNKNGIYFVKNKSPLYVAKGNGGVMIASDVTCFCGYADEYYQIPDGVFGVAEKDFIKFYDNLGEVSLSKVVLDAKAYDVNNTYKHYMLKEIYETKLAIKNIIEFYSNDQNRKKIDKINIDNINKVKFIGCGTAYHAALIGAKMLESKTGIECNAVVASEFRYSDAIIDNKTLVVMISQSGETADTLAAFELAKSKCATTVAIVNVEYSTLAKGVDVYLPIKAGVEIAVASTKAYSAQLTVLYLLAEMLAEKLGKSSFSLKEVNELYESLDFKSINDYKLIADALRYNDRLFMIGRGADYCTALEASLKIKETSYINSDTYYAGELKHGFLALIDNETYVIAFATDKKVFSKTISNAEEAKARGAKVILFTCFEIDEVIKDNFYYVIQVKEVSSELQCVINIVPWQLIAYFVSVSKGLNPDKPRNLAKSVTVE